MDTKIISEIFNKHFHQSPRSIEPCAIGIGNFVYIVSCGGGKYVLRCNAEENAYKNTIHWLDKLSALDIPVPRVLASGKYDDLEYLILTYIEGKDIGMVYSELTDDEKRQIAKDVTVIQEKASRLSIEVKKDWSWIDFIDDNLDRSSSRIIHNGYFDPEKVERLRTQKKHLNEYFKGVRPVPYLDDISTKNLLIHNGSVSGVIDVDWIGIGDSITFIALTYIALLNMKCDTDYIDYLLKQRQPDDTEKKAFLFYSLLFCVDFMGERGMQFLDKRIEVDPPIVQHLNNMYDDLWEKWCDEINADRT